MPRDDWAALNNHATLVFDADMSVAEVRENTARLLALGHRYNLLVEELERTAAAEDTPAGKQARMALSFAKLLADDPRLQTAPWFADLILPFMDCLVDEAVRADSKQADGVRRKRPAEFTLSIAIPRAYLALAADVLVRSRKSHDDTKAWLRSKLGKYGIKETAEAIMEWRDEIIARMGKRPAGELETEGTLLDLMAETFKDSRPTHALGQDEAEELAAQLIEAASKEQKRRLIPLA